MNTNFMIFFVIFLSCQTLPNSSGITQAGNRPLKETALFSELTEIAKPGDLFEFESTYNYTFNDKDEIVLAR
jgi:L-arabinose isomerase